MIKAGNVYHMGTQGVMIVLNKNKNDEWVGWFLFADDPKLKYAFFILTPDLIKKFENSEPMYDIYEFTQEKIDFMKSMEKQFGKSNPDNQ